MPNVWDKELLVNPHEVADKRRRVQQMFAAIAPSYDLNNRLHSFFMDQSWRKRAVKLAQLKPTDRVVDIACGTGDLSVAFLDGLSSLPPLPVIRGRAGEGVEQQEANDSQTADQNSTTKVPQVIGIDFTHEMLPLAVAKWHHHAATLHTTTNRVAFLGGDAQSLPLPDDSADVTSIAFGIRNVVDPFAAIKEFHRILRPSGRAIILEFSLPTNPLFLAMYNFYFKQILPRTATLISGDKTGAYKYLPQSVRTFINRQTMVQMLEKAGFKNVTQHPMTMGICIAYRGTK
jgi:demethylmenaquinone methyltransferase/2-methoxy-6-polyprenyl-1,4-benzoquinol methylase